MPFLTRALEATASGLLLALLAPPIAGAVFLLSSAASSAAAGEPFDSSLGSIFLLVIGVATGSYLLGAVPAFIAGLALPTLRRVLSPKLASVATGIFGVVLYFLTFGSHVISATSAISSLRIYALPAFLGIALAAHLAWLIESRRTEA